MDFDRALYETEDFLQRQFGSRAAREAQKRKVKQGIGEAFRRIRRAAVLFLVLLGGLILFDLAGGSVGIWTWLVAVPAMFLAALISLMFGTRKGRQAPARTTPGAPAQLDRLAAGTEDYLLERCAALPRLALPATDAIIDHLREMRPALAQVSAQDPAAGEAHRLLGQHLPNLVDSYLALPESVRHPDSRPSQRLAESLGHVADELDRLSAEVHRGHAIGFETQRRFIETRYKGDSEIG